MAADLILAILHHVLAFGLVSLLMAEGVLLSGEVNAALLDRLARLDGAYAGTAGAIVVVGVLRVFFGLKGSEYYIGNPWFWAKMASFVAVALLSMGPTRRFQVWRRAGRADPAFIPSAGELAQARRFLRAESLFVVLILVFAATMARLG